MQCDNDIIFLHDQSLSLVEILTFWHLAMVDSTTQIEGLCLLPVDLVEGCFVGKSTEGLKLLNVVWTL